MGLSEELLQPGSSFSPDPWLLTPELPPQHLHHFPVVGLSLSTTSGSEACSQEASHLSPQPGLGPPHGWNFQNKCTFIFVPSVLGVGL